MNTINRVVKFFLLQSILWNQIDWVQSFSPPSSSTFTSSFVLTSLPPSDSFRNPSQPLVTKFKRRMNLLSKMKKTDDAGDGDGDGDEGKVQNWLLALVIPLQLVYASNQLTRSSIYYLVDFSGGNGDGSTANAFRAMNVDLGFSEAQYGLLASLAFTTLFAVASLGAGAAADKYNRKTLTVLSAIGWSVAIIGTSMSTTYNEVLFWRIAMGLFCAFSTPTAYTLITEKVPTDRVSLATSIYGTGVAFGGGFASLSILLDNEIGWSQTSLAIGLVGFVCAFLVAAVVPSDDSKPHDSSKPAVEDDGITRSSSYIDDISEALSTTRAKWIFGGSFLRFSSGLCIGVWSAPYFRAAFPDNAVDYAVAQAFITVVAASISGLAGGVAADYLSSSLKSDNEKDTNENQDLTGIKLWVPVAGSLLAAPTWYLAIHSTESFQIAMLWLSIEYLVAECWFGPTISALLSTVPKNIGGTSQGLFTLTGALANLSPTLLGYLYGQATSDGAEMSSSELLPVLLTTGVCFGYVSSAFCFAMGARSPPPLATTKSKTN